MDTLLPANSETPASPVGGPQLASVVRAAHRRIALRRLELDGAAFLVRLNALMRVEGWLA